MKITVVLLFVTLFQAVAMDSYSQNTKVSVNAGQIKLSEVFSTIEKQSEFLFFYVDSDINGIYVNVNAQNKQISDVLNQALKETDLTYTINDRHINIMKKPQTSPKTKRVRGTITDQSGQPVIGANVLEKGTGNGTITDIDGKYSLDVAESAIIVISFIGYNSQEIPVANKNNIDNY
ncbi:STN domain-containing protein [Parabacteroides chongii]|uniref:STN domain-containing protein n=1 Tax=Parabacteroides chongii TaxID=2685834 RepID=UPI00240CFA6E|nr:SusC/RagA family TonB-linked outer membrane protein [Parabacteroides chongii]WFE86301.1 carboxypeptidase-like regulatory domain-containing protein [Parabacteroides chongii]